MTVPARNPSRRPSDLIGLVYGSLSNRLGKRLLNEVIGAKSLAPRLTLPKALAYAAATLIHVLTLLTAVFGVLLVVYYFPNPLLIFLGLVLLVLAFELRPRFAKLRDVPLPPEKAPALHSLVGAVAAELGTSSVDTIVVTADFNASMGRFGWRRRKVLRVGLPLFAALENQERVAILGHELGHAVNGDANRGFIVGSALFSLSTWYSVLRPDYGGRPSFYEMVASTFMAVLAQIPRLALKLLGHLSWHESQRAEYLADALAARIAGTEATITALNKLRYAVSFTTTVQRLALNDAPGDLFVELRRRVEQSVQAAASQPEEAAATRYRLDQTHPPTDYRVTFLESRAREPGRLRLSPAECEALEAELAALSPRIQKQLVDSYLRRLYR